MAYPESSSPLASQYDADRSFSSGSTQSPKCSNAGSVLLRDLLRERKAQNEQVADHTRTKATAQNGEPQDVRPPSKRRESHDGDSTQKAASRRNGSSRSGGAKQMGLREMEEFISKIKKENFDLKLELFHRRQRAEVLEAKFAHVEHLEKNNEELSRDNEEMQSINEDLLTELEKRDAAIQEAVGLICELEGKLEKVVSADRSSVRSGSTRGKPTPDQSPSQAVDRSLPAPHMPQTSSPSASRPKPKSQYKDVTPERLPESMPPPSKSSPKARALPPKQPRTPLFLQKEDPSTQALRNVYSIDGAALKSTLSLASIHRAHSNRTRNGQRIRADVDNYTLPSPRFSELSEGDFESVYGANRRPATPPHQSLNNQESISDEKISTRSAQRLSRSYSSQDSKISDWVQETRKSTSPARRDAPPRKSDKAYGSIEAVIGSRQAPPKRSPAQFSRVNELPPVFTQPVAKHTAARPTAAFGGPIFTGDILPPTPDTMSTSRLGTDRSNPSIVSEKSFVDKALDEFTKRVSERRPYTSESSRKGIKHDAPHYDDSDFEAEEEDPYLYTVNVPPRPPPHKVSDPSFSGRVSDRNFSGRPRLNSYSTDQPIPVARTVSYPASETTTRRRSSIQHSATSPDKSLAIPGPPLSEVYVPSDTSVNGGVPLLQQQQVLSPSTKYAGVATKAAAGHSFKPLSIKNTGPSAMTRFFRRSSITTPETLLINQQQPQYQQLQHPSQQTRPRMTQEQSSAPGRRSSFQGVAKALRMGRPSTSDGDGATTSERIITAVGAVVFDNDDSQEDVTDGVTEGHDQKGGGARGIGLGIGKKLVGLGRRGSKGGRDEKKNRGEQNQ